MCVRYLGSGTWASNPPSTVTPRSVGPAIHGIHSATPLHPLHTAQCLRHSPRPPSASLSPPNSRGRGRGDASSWKLEPSPTDTKRRREEEGRGENSPQRSSRCGLTPAGGHSCVTHPVTSPGGERAVGLSPDTQGIGSLRHKLGLEPNY